MNYPDLSRFPVVAIDTETTGLSFWKDKVFGVSVSTPDGKDYYWDTRDHGPRLVSWLNGQIRNSRCIFVGHSMKFDVHFLREMGVQLPLDRIDCTMVRAALLDEHRMAYDLDSLGMDCIGVGKDTDIYQKLADLFGGKPTRHEQIKNLPRAPVELVAHYAKQDTRTTLLLWQWQEEEIVWQELVRVHNLEKQLMPVLVDLEHRGVHVDVDKAELAAEEITKIVGVRQKTLDELAGMPINPNPSGSIHKLFNPKWDADSKKWVATDGTLIDSTAAGKPSIDANTLRRMKHPAAAMILELRKLIKARDTFILGHIMNYHHNGVIHANFNQTKTEGDVGTGTGRLSVNGPALQQIPKRDKELASIVRSLFIPDNGQDWSCIDWAQMDFRVFAHYVNNSKITAMYHADPNTDFHQVTADLTGLPRSARFAGDPNAKQINLGLVFGMGSGKLAAEMGLPFESVIRRGKEYLTPGEEAMAVFEKYHSSVVGVDSLLKRASSVARSRGYVKTIMGRHIRFPGGQFVHKAGGLIFQGSAADALKQKLVEVHKFLDGTDARLLLNVHDEFDSSIPKGDTKTVNGMKDIVECFDGINTPIKFNVPIRSDHGIGPNWWMASK